MDLRLGIRILTTRVLSATNKHPSSTPRHALAVSRKGLGRALRY